MIGDETFDMQRDGWDFYEKNCSLVKGKNDYKSSDVTGTSKVIHGENRLREKVVLICTFWRNYMIGNSNNYRTDNSNSTGENLVRNMFKVTTVIMDQKNNFHSIVGLLH